MTERERERELGQEASRLEVHFSRVCARLHWPSWSRGWSRRPGVGAEQEQDHGAWGPAPELEPELEPEPEPERQQPGAGADDLSDGSHVGPAAAGGGARGQRLGLRGGRPGARAAAVQ